jgi:hypothetical protein
MADTDYASSLFSRQAQEAPPEQQVDYASRMFSGNTAIGTAPLYKTINLLLTQYKDNT